MKIETNDYITISEACKKTNIPPATFYRIARRLGVAVEFFGAKVVKKSDVPKVVADKKPIGNQLWIADSEAAAKSAMKAVRSRLRRIAEHGMTDAELGRGERIREARAAKR